tara:strand:+ start:11335 stop:12204 length:870 start_codon:yes stop_codon:yes gene_type:complete
MVDALREQYKSYRQKHPNTELSESDYIEREMKKRQKRDPSPEKEEGESGPSEEGEKADEKSKSKKKTPKPTPEDTQVMTDLGLDENIDLEKLSNALDSILEGQKGTATTFAEKLEKATDFLTQAVDVDQYILGLPDDAKKLAAHLQERQEKMGELAKKSLSEGASYDDYVKSLGSKASPLSKSQWEAIQKKELDKSLKSLQTTVTQGKSFPATYQEYVKSQRDDDNVPVSKSDWDSVMDKARKSSEKKLRDELRKGKTVDGTYDEYVERKEGANEVPVAKAVWEQIVGK